MKTYESPVTGESGTENHPAFGMVTWHRVHASPGKTLFGSDIPHSEYVVVSVHTATRRRDLHSDWTHSEKTVIEFSMSLAQFAAFMTAGNTEGVTCTLDWHGGELPGLKPESRLAQTTSEARAAADKAFAAIKDAQALYMEVLARKAPAAERSEALRDVNTAIANAAANVEFAAQQLTRHTEHVVQTARADIEGYVAAAQARGAALETGPVLSIEGSEDQ